MRAKLLAGAVALAGAASLLVGALAPSPERTAEATETAAVDAADALAPAGTGGLPSLSALTERAEATGTAEAYAQLGLAHLRQARDAADPSALSHAGEALRQSLDRGESHAGFAGMAALANARHDFSGSVAWSRRAIALNPHNAAAYGLLGDALFELGRVRAAAAAYQRMVDVRPDVASYVRASYALQHHGRSGAALAALRLALQAAGPSGETAAWVRHQLGDVHAARGDVRAAARANRIGMAMAPGYAPPQVGLAEAQIARGRLRAAIASLEPAAAALPSLEYLITLGDLYRATGQRAAAEAQYAAAASKLRAYREHGVLADADLVVFYADHGLRLRAALNEARSIYRDRPTAKVADAYAWALHANGRDAAAWRLAREAIGGPAPDPAALFHAAVIARLLDRDGVAARLAREALRVDPAFSVVDAPRARRLASLV